MIYKVKNNFSPVVREPIIESVMKADLLSMSSGSEVLTVERGGYPYGSFINVKHPITNVCSVVNSAFIVRIRHKKIVCVSYDMTANRNFGKIVRHYYMVNPEDEIQIVHSNTTLCEKEKPHILEIVYGDDEYTDNR